MFQRQYKEAVGCALGLEQVAKLREFRALRPAAPVGGHARLWWVYALKCLSPHSHCEFAPLLALRHVTRLLSRPHSFENAHTSHSYSLLRLLLSYFYNPRHLFIPAIVHIRPSRSC